MGENGAGVSVMSPIPEFPILSSLAFARMGREASRDQKLLKGWRLFLSPEDPTLEEGQQWAGV